MSARSTSQRTAMPADSELRAEQILSQLVMQHLGGKGLAKAPLHIAAYAVAAENLVREVLQLAQLLQGSVDKRDQAAPTVKQTSAFLQELLIQAPATMLCAQDATGFRAWVGMAEQLERLSKQQSDSKQHEQLINLHSLLQEYDLVCTVGAEVVDTYTHYRAVMAQDAAAVSGDTAAKQTQLVQQHSRAARLRTMHWQMVVLCWEIAQQRTEPQTTSISRGDQQVLNPVSELLDASGLALLILLFRLPLLGDEELPAALREISSDMHDVAAAIHTMLSCDAAAHGDRSCSLFAAAAQVQPTDQDLPPVLQQRSEKSVFLDWLRASKVLEMLRDGGDGFGQHVMEQLVEEGDVFGAVVRRLAALDKIFWGEGGMCVGAVGTACCGCQPLEEEHRCYSSSSSLSMPADC